MLYVFLNVLIFYLVLVNSIDQVTKEVKTTQNTLIIVMGIIFQKRDMKQNKWVDAHKPPG